MIPYKIHDLIFFLFNLSHLPYIVHCPVNHILTYHTVNLLCNNVWRVVLKYLAAHITGFTFLLFLLILIMHNLQVNVKKEYEKRLKFLATGT
jgi:hypothetical protein